MEERDLNERRQEGVKEGGESRKKRKEEEEKGGGKRKEKQIQMVNEMKK